MSAFCLKYLLKGLNSWGPNWQLVSIVSGSGVTNKWQAIIWTSGDQDLW